MTAFPRDTPLQRGGHDKHAEAETHEAAPHGSTRPKASPLAYAPHDTVSWMSRLFFCWVNPVTSRCLDSSVRAELLPPLSTADEAELKRGALDDALRREETTALHPSILRATLKHFWPAVLTATLWSVFRELLSFASTFLLKELLADDEKGGPRAWQQGLLAAGGLSGVQLLLVFLDSHLDFYSCRIMIRVETALLTSLYKRILNSGFGGDAPSVCIRNPPPRLSHSQRSTRHSRPSEEEEEAFEKQQRGGEPAHKGALFNAIFVDIPSAADMVLTALDLIIMPLRITLAVILLVVQVGASCVPGVLALFVIIFCTVSLTAYNATLKIPFMRTRDARLERSHECLKEMRTLRLLGWEDIAEDLVNKRREKEMGWLSFRMYLAGVSYWLTSVAGMATSVATFAAYTIPFIQGSSGALSMRPELVIPVIHMMDVFVGPLTDLPYSISTVIEGQISLKRLQRYLFRAQHAAIADTPEKAAGRDRQEPEAESQPLLSEKGNGDEGEMPAEQAEADSRKDELLEMATAIAGAIHDPALKVRFLDASFCWKNSTCADSGVSVKAEKDGGPVVISRERVDARKAALNHITLDVKCGQVILITGPPGSGKTTLLQSILQQDSLALTSGASYVYRGCEVRGGNTGNTFEGLNVDNSKERLTRAPIGYVPQDPWLCGGTIRENIIFGDVFNLTLYNKVIKACELNKDFASWRNGDLRVIDEGGLDLSGGQRVRVNIARAAYGCKMHQMRMNAEREQGEKEVERHQEHLLKCLVNAIAVEDQNNGGILEELEKKILCDLQKSKKSSSSCLLCFDECFNSLDLSVAGHVFHNLLGPAGLLTDCAVVLCLNKSSLLGLLHQHAGQEGFHEHRNECTFQEKGNGNTTEAEASTRMQFTICILAEGSISWRGGVSDFIRINDGFRPPGEVDTSAATIENLLAVNAPCKEEDEYPGIENGESKIEDLHPSGSSDDIRTLSVAEHAASGRVQAASYFWYMKHTGRLLCVVFFVIVTLGSVCDVAGDLWLSKWTAFHPSDQGLSTSGISSTPLNLSKERTVQEDQRSVHLSHRRFLWIFACIAAANIFFELFEKTFGVVGSVRAARSLHQHLWAGVCNAPLWFYDQNPLGRILNRFTTDVSVVDGGILRRIGYAFVAAVSFVLSVFVLSAACKWVIPFWPFMLASIYLFAFRYFRSTSREVQRASLLSFSPLCSCFSEAISGNAVICSLQKQRFFLMDMTYHLDLCQRTKQMQWGISSWSSIRIELMLFPLVIFSSTLPAFLNYEGNTHSSTEDVASNDQSNIGLIGLAISYSISIAGALRRFLSSVTHMEKEMCSVERIQQSYLTETEYQRLGPAFQHPPPSTSGTTRGRGGGEFQSSVLPLKRTGLVAQKVEVRYRAITSEEASALKAPPVLTDMPRFSVEQQERQSAEDEKADDIEANHLEIYQNCRKQAFYLKPSIRDFSAVINPGEHIGIVGRTGAGKSTLLQAFYGLIPCHKGVILMDGIRVDCLPRQVLRNVVGFLPQRSVVFEGWTVRDVLDPRRQHDDLTLWEALRVVGLDTTIASLPGGAELDTVLVGESSEFEGRNGKKRMISAKSSSKQNIHPLSAQQLRYLALGRLVADAPELRLVLIDEPPAEEIWDQASFKSVGAESVSTAGGVEPPPLGRARCITDIIATHFQQASVIIVAHHLSSLRGCDRVWVLADGRKVGECNPAEIDTEQKFNTFVAACSEQPQ
ncbi:hypothetical protein Esti_002929 [Eimeria stiedai]